MIDKEVIAQDLIAIKNSRSVYLYEPIGGGIEISDEDIPALVKYFARHAPAPSANDDAVKALIADAVKSERDRCRQIALDGKQFARTNSAETICQWIADWIETPKEELRAALARVGAR